MGVHRLCEWCGEANPVGAGHPPLCPWCGHRGDLARAECDCERCKPPGPADEEIPWHLIQY